MGENTGIEWCDHTFNPWLGCTKISPACDHCYAETWSQRFPANRKLWSGERRRTSESNWKQPLKWNRQAEQLGVRKRVFCASLADVFDNQVSAAWRDDLWRLIWGTPALDWLLLTKRPQNIAKMLPNHTGRPWPFPNVWLGTTVENHEEAIKRVPHLLAVPTVVRFLSCEPLLGPVNLNCLLVDGVTVNALGGKSYVWDGDRPSDRKHGLPRVHWVIAGGESGPKRRELQLEWMYSLRYQCAVEEVPFFGKQWDKVRDLPPILHVHEWPEAA